MIDMHEKLYWNALFAKTPLTDKELFVTYTLQIGVGTVSNYHTIHR